MKSQHQKQYKCVIDALKKARLDAGMTQNSAAKAIGKHAPFISKIESGERRVDIVELNTLCAIYNISLSDLLKNCGLLSN